MRAILVLAERTWLPVTLGLLAAILYLSLGPRPETAISELPRGFQLQHLVAYGALALPVGLVRPRGWGWWVAGFAALGGAIEILQPAVGRSGSAEDFLANLGGLALGLAVGALLRAVLATRPRRS